MSVIKQIKDTAGSYDMGADAKYIFLNQDTSGALPNETYTNLQDKITRMNYSLNLPHQLNESNLISMAKGEYSTALGRDVKAFGRGAHAEGDSTVAGNKNATIDSNVSPLAQYPPGAAAHAEGIGSLANEQASHAEGYKTQATGMAAHAEGSHTHAEGEYSHAEGGSDTITSISFTDSSNNLVTISGTTARGKGSHAEGCQTLAYGSYSHAEGEATFAHGYNSHAEGWGTIAMGQATHAEGEQTTATGSNSHAEGWETIAGVNSSHAEGYKTQTGSDTPLIDQMPPIKGIGAHAEGVGSCVNAKAAHAEGYNTIANADYAHVEGNQTIAQRMGGHAEGNLTQAIGVGAHAEGSAYSRPDGPYPTEVVESNWRDFIVKEETITAQGPIAMGDASHAEGISTLAYGRASHTEGYGTLAQGDSSHAEGDYTQANGKNSHAEGSPFYKNGQYSLKTLKINDTTYTLYGSWAEGEGSHAEGVQTFTLGKGSHAEGIQTEARGEASHAEGYTTIAEGSGSHVEGKNNQGQGPAIHIEGQENIVKVNSTAVHIEGYGHVADLQPCEISFARTYSLSSLGVRNTISLNQSKIFFDEPYNYQLSEVFLDVESDYSLLQGEVFGSYGLNIQKVAYETSSNSLFFQSPPDIQAYLNNFSVSKALIKPVGDLLTKGAHVQGCWSKIDNYAHIVGNGISNTNRRNIHTIDWDGNAEFAGDVIAYGCEGENPISLKALAEKEYIGQKTKQEGEIFNDYIGNIANYHAHAEGRQTKSQGNYSHAEGLFTYALGQCAHAEGESNMATGLDSHAEGCDLVAFGPYSHAEGGSNGMSFIIQLTGDVNTERYIVSKTEETKRLLKGGIIKFVDNSLEPPMNRNYATIVQFDNATQELVLDRTLSENRSLQNTTVYCYCCGAFSKSSHSEGIGTVATGRSQHVQGEYNIIDSKNTIGTGNRGTYAHIVGNGTGANNRSNAHTLDWSGNAMFAGDIQFKYNDDIQSLSAILKNLQSQIDALKK